METRPAHTETTLRPPAFAVRPLSAALGAEIIGIDLSKDIDEHVCAQIRDAWHQHLVILLRDQELSEEDQVRFAEMFGPPAVIHTKQFVRSHPAVMLISNIREDGKPIGALPDGEMHFHTDQCHQERPAMASMLYALEVPSAGGNTLFANGYKAYETLPDEIKRRIDGRKALNAYDYDTAAMKRGTRIAEGVPSLCSSRGSHPSGDRPQGALRQPPDDRADRRIARPGERRIARHAVRSPGAPRIHLRARVASG